jgi:FSR family fosmidomycin resistance protein-like MFS transporter
VSCAVQAASGFLVDRIGPRPVLFGGLALLGAGGAGLCRQPSYWMLAAFSVLAGIGNGVFHPVDYTLINRKVHATAAGPCLQRARHHRQPGLGAGAGAAGAGGAGGRLARGAGGRRRCAFWACWLLLWLAARPTCCAAMAGASQAGRLWRVRAEGPFDFLRIPAVWMCFAFFFFYAVALSVVQSFCTRSGAQMHGCRWPGRHVPDDLHGAQCRRHGGWAAFLASDPARCERVVGGGLWPGRGDRAGGWRCRCPGWRCRCCSALMGLASGSAGPSRDLLVKRITPDNASGRVYGVVYAGLDIGQALAPLFFGR